MALRSRPEISERMVLSSAPDEARVQSGTTASLGAVLLFSLTTGPDPLLLPLSFFRGLTSAGSNDNKGPRFLQLVVKSEKHIQEIKKIRNRYRLCRKMILLKMCK